MDKNPAQENNKKYYVRSSEIHEVTSTGMLPLILLDRERLEAQKGYRRVKRAFDLCVSVLAGILLFFPIMIIAGIVYLDDPHGSPFFVQDRIGKDGRIFRFYKIRSMYVDAEDRLEGLLDENDMDGPVFKMKDDPRITRVGRFLRRSSIDELPQLLNVVKNDISLVGPRPALPREYATYSQYQKQREYVLPGLSCLWQTRKSRNDIPYDEWLYLDLKYIQERSFFGDIKIIFKTFGAVFRGDGC